MKPTRKFAFIWLCKFLFLFAPVLLLAQVKPGSWDHAEITSLPASRPIWVNSRAQFTEPVLVILAQLPDAPTDKFFQTDQAYWARTFFGAKPSVSGYYAEVSYGKVQFEPARENDATYNGSVNDGVVGWLKLPKTFEQYKNTGEFEVAIARDAILGSNVWIDFAQFDTDTNGYLETTELHIYVIVSLYELTYRAGNKYEIGRKTFPFHDPGFGSNLTPVTLDGKIIGDAGHQKISIAGEMLSQYRLGLFDAPNKVGLLAHELGHQFGLPEHYDKEFPAGVWCIMGTGDFGSPERDRLDYPAHPCAPHKIQAKWLEPRVIKSDQFVFINEAEKYPHALKLWENGNPDDEYFVVENRNVPNGNEYDSGLPGSGFLIWHVDSTQIKIHKDKGIALEQADGEGLNGVGNAGDPFSANTNPNFLQIDSKSNQDDITGVAVTNITAPGPTMSAHITVTHTATNIIVSASPSAIQANGTSTATIAAVLQDAWQDTVESATNEVTFTVASGSSSGQLISPNPVKAINGIATITLRSTSTPGLVIINGISQGLTSSATSVDVTPVTTIRIVSDATWRVSGTLEPNWETISFNDTSWEFTVTPASLNCGNINSPWHPGVLTMWSSFQHTTIYLRKSFFINFDTSVGSASIMSASDDDHEIYVNGSLVAADHNGVAGPNLTTHIRTYLRHGSNVIAIKAIDTGGCRMMSVDARIAYFISGAISGIVKDAITNQPIQGASVSTSGGYSDPDGSDASGFYQILDVPVGSGYIVTASARGYQTAQIKNVSVEAAQTTIVNFTLQPIVYSGVFFEDFENPLDPSMFTLNGTATQDTSRGTLELTGLRNSAAGSIFYNIPLNLSNFRVSFDFHIFGGSGADGLTFAFANETTPALLGKAGGLLGFFGIKGYAVEFDTWWNTPHDGPNDPSENHCGISITDGPNLVSLVTTSNIPELEDTGVHSAEIECLNGRILVTLDGTLVIDYQIPDFNPYTGFVGFTGATGDFTNHHQIDNVRFESGTVVSVELVSFEGFVNDNGVLLKWTTALEANLYGFEVERSVAKSSAPTSEHWEKIGFVPGHGTTTPQSYSFTDKNVPIGIYYYRLKQINTNGSFEYSQAVQVIIEPPQAFALSQNYPNPFNPETTIEFTLPKSEYVSLCIFNVQGQEVRVLISEHLQPGFHSVQWDGRDEENRQVPSGVYIYRMKTESFTASRKLVVTR